MIYDTRYKKAFLDYTVLIITYIQVFILSTCYYVVIFEIIIQSEREAYEYHPAP